MVLLNETRRIHEVLGEICFDDGKGDPKIGTEDGAPFWLARPMGWSANGVEILLSGDSLNPASTSLERAIQVFKSLDRIEKEGRELIRPMILGASSQGIDVTHYEAAFCGLTVSKRVRLWCSIGMAFLI
jgi:hypothetical protein